jgi:hypothetical protein
MSVGTPAAASAPHTRSRSRPPRPPCLPQLRPRRTAPTRWPLRGAAAWWVEPSLPLCDQLTQGGWDFCAILPARAESPLHLVGIVNRAPSSAPANSP